MTYEIIAVLVIVIIGLVLFLTEIVRVDITAMILMVLLMLSGVLSPEEGISGFSNPATITVMALLMLSAGLQATGAVNAIGKQMLKYTGKTEWQTLLMLMIAVGFISAFINNTAAVAVFLPVTIRIANSTGISVSKLLIPLSVAAMLGGTCTLIGTSTNLLVSSLSEASGKGSFSMFEFTPLGVIFLCSGIVYMLFAGRFLTPARRKPENVSEDYGIKEYLTELIILPDSPFIGKNLKETELGEKYNVDVLEVIRKGYLRLNPEQVAELMEDDVLLAKGEINKLVEISSKVGISIKASIDFYESWLQNEDLILTEAIVSPDSFLNGKTIQNIGFRSRYNANVLAVRRNGKTEKAKLRDIRLKFGDSLLILTSKDNIESLRATNDFILLNEIEESLPFRKNMIIATAIMISVILFATFDFIPILPGSLAGVILMFLTRCISVRKAYKEMDWQIFFLLAGIIPLGMAIEKTGAGIYLARAIFDITGNLGPVYIIATLYISTTLLTEILSNNAAAVLLAPIAISIGELSGIPAKALLFTIMFAASTSFLTPIGYQTNTMIYGPGKYRYTDYFRSGALLNLLLWIIASLGISYLWID